MDAPLQFLSDNLFVKALANAFGIIAGLIILWKGGGVAARFLRDIAQNNIRSAYIRYRYRNYRLRA